jgi:hypothetical protein
MTRSDGDPGSSARRDPALAALDELVRAAQEIGQAAALVESRAALIREYRRQGLPYREIVTRRDGPLIAELLTGRIHRFEAAGTRFRAAEARALHDEGMSMEQIGALFGLTRQRISALLRTTRPPSADHPQERPARQRPASAARTGAAAGSPRPVGVTRGPG